MIKNRFFNSTEDYYTLCKFFTNVYNLEYESILKNRSNDNSLNGVLSKFFRDYTSYDFKKLTRIIEKTDDEVIGVVFPIDDNMVVKVHPNHKNIEKSLVKLSEKVYMTDNKFGDVKEVKILSHYDDIWLSSLLESMGYKTSNSGDALENHNLWTKNVRKVWGF